MEPFHNYLPAYRKQLEKGDIKKAYVGLMNYLKELRLYLHKAHPGFEVSSSISFGNMDYSYFFFFPKSLKEQKLKIVILFNHEKFEFEIWLAGFNKGIQTKYLELFTKSNWNKYNIASTTVSEYSIVDHKLTDNPDFSKLNKLTMQLEKGTMTFIKDIEQFLSNH